MQLPLVSIVLATYRPNTDFLIKQLMSIYNQTYSPIELLICDDSADGSQTFAMIEHLAEKIFAHAGLSYSLLQNETNLGSTATFERLTAIAHGKYIAYCDQDDIWEEDKIMCLVELIEKEGSEMAYSDLAVIDGQDNLKHKSFREMNRRIVHMHGNDLFSFFLQRNCVTGCTMLIHADVAKAAIPFLKCFVHDHFLALYASSRGAISYYPQPLIRYRIHGNNQIGAAMLKGVRKKEDYYINKLIPEKEKASLLRSRFQADPLHSRFVDEFAKWIDVRIAFFQKHSLSNLRNLLSYFPRDCQLVFFELVMFLLPNSLFSSIIKVITKAR